MNVLGIHIGHDSSAALIVDGKIIADTAEERFTRIKHYSGWPLQSIQYCLSFVNDSIDNLDAIAIPSVRPVSDLNYLLNLKGRQKQRASLKKLPLAIMKKLSRDMPLKPPLYIKSFNLNKSVPIIHVGHHLAHAAGACYTSGTRDKQIIATIDGIGDGLACCIWKAEAGKITPLYKLGRKSSIGWFYSLVTEALGWWHGDGEGKTMGLAPYGDNGKCRGTLDAYYPKFENGKLVEGHNFGSFCRWNQNGAIQWHMEESPEVYEFVQRYGRENIAAEAQRVLEEQVCNFVLPWLEKENTKKLSCAGGVFLNVKLNQRLWESGKIADHHIFPNPGDAGLAAGAALHVYYENNPTDTIHPIDNSYWGPSYEDQVQKVLDMRNLDYTYIEAPEETAAEFLAENKIIGWFQGRMESGPRALGNRSILMSANRAGNKDILNSRVKFREAFRPFCPSLLWESKDDYLDNARDENFMITSFDMKRAKKTKVPAVVHVDGTARPQTVKKQYNEKYWKLIKAFGDITGENIILNTSFNIMGEPIINHPREAIRCFYDNGLDHLFLGNFLLSKG